MNVSPLASLSSAIRPDAMPPEKLAPNSQSGEPDKIQELSQQFEALLVRQILKESRKSVIESGLFGQSFSADLYHDMINGQLAEQISQSGTMGLASRLEKDLSQRYQHDSTQGENHDE
jgi:peptidoglycan hydrolase FlgJ